MNKSRNAVGWSWVLALSISVIAPLTQSAFAEEHLFGCEFGDPSGTPQPGEYLCGYFPQNMTGVRVKCNFRIATSHRATNLTSTPCLDSVGASIQGRLAIAGAVPYNSDPTVHKISFGTWGEITTIPPGRTRENIDGHGQRIDVQYPGVVSSSRALWLLLGTSSHGSYTQCPNDERQAGFSSNLRCDVYSLH